MDIYIVRWALQLCVSTDQVGVSVRYRLLFGRCSIRLSPGTPDGLIWVIFGFPQSLRELPGIPLRHDRFILNTLQFIIN
jgi:hypothetical protein